MTEIVFPAVVNIGTRKSPLAIAQSETAQSLIKSRFPQVQTQIVSIVSEGDKHQNIALQKIGGKGVFVSSLEKELQQKKIDIAVHSFKDIPPEIPEDLHIAAVFPRADPRDALISRQGITLETLPFGAKIGTASPRRRAQLLAFRPDFKIELLRGNVGTRLEKIANGMFDATLLALAGLERLNMLKTPTENGTFPIGYDLYATALALDDWLPAATQGIIALECRKSDLATTEILRLLNDADSFACAQIERQLLMHLAGNCHSQIAVYASGRAEKMRLRANIWSADGKLHSENASGNFSTLMKIAAEIGKSWRAFL
jgi:hydroxymethylbilane synthase